MTTRKTILTLLLAICSVVLIGGFVVVAAPPLPAFLSSTDALKDFAQSSGWIAPVVIILYHALQVVIAPIPGQGIDFANGYLFGLVFGSIYSLIGLGIGSALAMLIARKFGRPIVELLVTKRGMKTVDQYLSKSSLWVIFVLFLLPATPDDLLCFALGLSSIPLGRGLLIAMLGRAPGIVATVLVGSAGSVVSPVEFTIAAILLTLLMMLVLYIRPKHVERKKKAKAARVVVKSARRKRR